jgi:hypothetical protein
MAFCCAVEPDAVNVPFAHCDAAGLGALDELEALLLSVPHALSESAAAATNAPAPASRLGLNTGKILLLCSAPGSRPLAGTFPRCRRG